jgi:hypothetical protein
MGHVLMENRNGLAVDATHTHATGTAEGEATLAMLDRRKGTPRITLGADKAYDVTGFIGDLSARKVTPHIAVNGAVSKTGTVRKTAMDGRSLRRPHRNRAGDQLDPVRSLRRVTVMNQKHIECIGFTEDERLCAGPQHAEPGSPTLDAAGPFAMQPPRQSMCLSAFKFAGSDRSHGQLVSISFRSIYYAFEVLSR